MFRIELSGRTFLLTVEELFGLLEKLPRDQTINVVDIMGYGKYFHRREK